jgi:hypothetical protein
MGWFFLPVRGELDPGAAMLDAHRRPATRAIA